MSFKKPNELVDVFINTIGKNKTNYKIGQIFLLGLLAGVYISFGALSALKSYSFIENHAIASLLAGALFSVGLMLIIIGGGELFTGNSLILLSVMTKKVKVVSMLRNWLYVYLSNFLGALFIVFLIINSGLLYQGNDLNAIGETTVSIALQKTHLTFSQAFIKGILCNWLVSLAVWLSLASEDITGKILGIFFPIMTFVYLGFEHSIANMFIIPLGCVLSQDVTLSGLIKNLIPVTLGNIIGGSVFVGLFYFLTYNYYSKKTN
ncbi:MAG: formate/nitrite transporter family protein [Candidatus Cloacimonetes bacterium]|jgi:formate/nitrite transporter|nr:formate/nitrite transporter family protein [Candidatus Cloacimonadota bacterium]MDD4155080.1 formate/nitrite transporter family protein [Candidatus Cloacimonadota bacterium]